MKMTSKLLPGTSRPRSRICGCAVRVGHTLCQRPWSGPERPGSARMVSQGCRTGKWGCAIQSWPRLRDGQGRRAGQSGSRRMVFQIRRAGQCTGAIQARIAYAKGRGVTQDDQEAVPGIKRRRIRDARPRNTISAQCMPAEKACCRMISRRYPGIAKPQSRGIGRSVQSGRAIR